MVGFLLPISWIYQLETEDNFVYYLTKKIEEEEIEGIYCDSKGVFAVLKNKEEIKIPTEFIPQIIGVIEECSSTTYSSNMGKNILFTKANLEQLRKCIDYI